jgi:hypothetical protein
MRKDVRLATSHAPFVAIPSWVGHIRWPMFGIILLRRMDPVSLSQMSPTDIGLAVLFGFMSSVKTDAVRNFAVLVGIRFEAILFNIVRMFIFMSWPPHWKICFINEALHPVMPLALIFNWLMPLDILS